MNIVKNCNKIEVLKAWDYARTIFESEKLRIAYIKAEIGTGKAIFFDTTRHDATRRDDSFDYFVKGLP